MNQANWHIALNHFPIVGTIFATLILLVGLYARSTTVQLVALWLFVAAALVAIPVLLTGEGAEEIVEHLPGVEHDRIEEHEDQGKISFWLFAATGFLSLIYLYMIGIKRIGSKLLLMVIAVVAIGASASGLIAANTGGDIRHTEFNNNGAEK